MPDDKGHMTPEQHADRLLKSLEGIKGEGWLRLDLKQCRDGQWPCGLQSCRLCRETYQGAFARALCRALKDDGEALLITIIPEDGWCPPGKIGDFDFKAFVKRHLQKIGRVLPDDVVYAGGVDVAYLSFRGDPVNWQVHIHLVAKATTTSRDEIAAALRAVYPNVKDKDIYQAVDVRFIKKGELEKTERYCSKSFFCQRLTYTTTSLGRADFRQSVKPPPILTAQQDLELQLAWSDLKVGSLLMFRGLRRKRSADIGKMRLEFMSRRKRV